MPNAAGWQRIRTVLPNAVAYAIDKGGMQVAFDVPPIYHKTGRWIPQGVGNKVGLGLIDVTADHDFEGSLQWAPDYDPDKSAQEAAQEAHNNDESIPDMNPGVKATDPKERGPDADGRPEEAEAERVALGGAPSDQLNEHEIKQMKAMGAEVVESKPIVESKLTVEEEVAPSAREEALLQLVLKMADQLPKTKRAKVEDDLAHVRRVYRVDD